MVTDFSKVSKDKQLGKVKQGYFFGATAFCKQRAAVHFFVRMAASRVRRRCIHVRIYVRKVGQTLSC